MHQIPSGSGKVEPNSQDQTLRSEPGQGNFPVQLAMRRIGNHTWLVSNLPKVMTTHTHTHELMSITFGEKGVNIVQIPIMF